MIVTREDQVSLFLIPFKRYISIYLTLLMYYIKCKEEFLYQAKNILPLIMSLSKFNLEQEMAVKTFLLLRFRNVICIWVKFLCSVIKWILVSAYNSCHRKVKVDICYISNVCWEFYQFSFRKFGFEIIYCIFELLNILLPLEIKLPIHCDFEDYLNSIFVNKLWIFLFEKVIAAVPQMYAKNFISFSFKSLF